MLSLGRVSSPLGTLLLVSDGAARLRALDFHDHEARMLRLLGLQVGEGGFALTEAPAPAALREALERFFAGELAAVTSIRFETGGTELQRRVWKELRRIPAGTTSTYGSIAAKIGRPRACRAVGRANGANPIAIVVPCHRVIGRDGSLTGYAGGVERKQWLLEHERRSIA